MAENLLIALTVLERCLSYDYMTVVSNETLIDNPGQTFVPLSWRSQIENPALLELLFKILTTPMTDPASS